VRNYYKIVIGKV